MAHKVVVMSPLHNLGASVVSEFIAHGITFDNKTSMLLFTNMNSLHPHYLGVDDIDDPTRSIMQVVKLIEAAAINDSDILYYAHNYTKNAFMMNITDPSLTAHDRLTITQHVFDRVPTDLAVCDNADDIGTDLSKHLIETADIVFIVIDMSPKAAQHLKLWLEDPLFKDNPNVFIIVNMYSEEVNSMRGYAKFLNFPANKVCKVHYNPYIQKCCNNRQMHTILPLAREADPRVACLLSDLKEITQCINSSMLMKGKRVF